MIFKKCKLTLPKYTCYIPSCQTPHFKHQTESAAPQFKSLAQHILSNISNTAQGLLPQYNGTLEQYSSPGVPPQAATLQASGSLISRGSFSPQPCTRPFSTTWPRTVHTVFHGSLNVRAPEQMKNL